MDTPRHDLRACDGTYLCTLDTVGYYEVVEGYERLWRVEVNTIYNVLASCDGAYSITMRER